jgi:hypothetical protein
MAPPRREIPGFYYGEYILSVLIPRAVDSWQTYAASVWHHTCSLLYTFGTATNLNRLTHLYIACYANSR